MNLLIKQLKELHYLNKFNLKKDRIYLIKKYQQVFGSAPNFESPQTFNEKLIAMNLHDRDIMKTALTDKLAVRKFIHATLGEQYLIPLLMQTTTPQEINKESLPDTPVIVKTNHASGKVYLIKNKHNFDFKLMYEDLTKRLQNNFYFNLREWQYKHIQPKVLVEELLLTEEYQVPDDYKIHCFNGKPTFIQIDTARFQHHQRSIFDLAWNMLDIEYGFPSAGKIKQPENLTEILSVAKKLSSQFPYCRVDLYTINSRIYFGELTFSPGGGFTPFKPENIDLEWEGVQNSVSA